MTTGLGEQGARPRRHSAGPPSRSVRSAPSLGVAVRRRTRRTTCMHLYSRDATDVWSARKR